MGMIIKHIDPHHYKKIRKYSGIGEYHWLNFYRMLKKILGSSNGFPEDNAIFQPVCRYIGSAEKKGIVDYCKGVQSENELEDLFSSIFSGEVDWVKFKKALNEMLDEYIAQINEKKDRKAYVLQQRRYGRLASIFTMNPLEIELIRTISILQSFSLMENMEPGMRAAILSTLVKRNKREISRAINEDGWLRQCGCLNPDLELNEDVEDFLAGKGEKKLLSRYFMEIREKSIPWDNFIDYTGDRGDLVISLLNGKETDRGINILFYGEEGNEQRHLVISLAGLLKRKIYTIKSPADKDESSLKSRFAALRICGENISTEKSLILVDGCEGMLDMSLFPIRIKELKVPCIWMTDSSGPFLNSSARKCFDYSINFEKSNHRLREYVWNRSIKKYGMNQFVSNTDSGLLSAGYDIDVETVEKTVRNAATILNSGRASEEKSDRLFDRLLIPHYELTGKLSRSANPVNEDIYSLEGLNIKGNIPLDEIILAAERYAALKERDYPLNILLMGPPGTGKSEFVKHLGKCINKQVRTSLGSDLLGMFVGQTERNISEVFRKAESENAILFLDEADGIIRSRTQAARGWEITQVNEVIQRMENFRGILVCATNFAENLDNASIRRFTFKVELDYLNNEGKALFFEKYFRVSLNSVEKSRLDEIPCLSAGDFRTVFQKFHYLGRELRGIPELLDALEEESRLKDNSKRVRTIGFV